MSGNGVYLGGKVGLSKKKRQNYKSGSLWDVIYKFGSLWVILPEKNNGKCPDEWWIRQRYTKGISLSRERKNEWQWRDDKAKVYTLNSAYTKLKNNNFVQECFSYSGFWKMKILPSAQFFEWRVIITKVATQDNLEMRGIEVGNRMCVLCDTNEETINHMFFSYDVTSHV